MVAGWTEEDKNVVRRYYLRVKSAVIRKRIGKTPDALKHFVERDKEQNPQYWEDLHTRPLYRSGL